MYKICICDDDNNFVEHLKKKIKEIATKENLNIEILQFSSGKSLLFELEETNWDVDIFFIDILMPDISGIETAKVLREWGNKSQIIFFTSSKEHVFDAFDVMPLHYLVKNEVTEDTIKKILLKAVSLAKQNKIQRFYYKVGHTLKCVDVQDILYFEIKNRILYMYCLNDYNDKFYFTMKKLEKSIDKKKFIRIHRSYLVNLYNITAVEGDYIVCKNKVRLPIGEKYLAQVKKQYSEFVLAGLEVL